MPHAKSWFLPNARSLRLMGFSTLASHVILAGGLMSGNDMGLSWRSVYTNATCSSNLAWMKNSEGQAPCLAVGYVLGACVGDVWNVPALLPNDHYDPPNTSNDTVNGCSCSWSSYNLYSACTVCQGGSPLTWGTWIEQCPNSDSSSYFPSGYTLSSNSSIPYWAATNPGDWQDAIFNVTQAQMLAGQGHADLKPGAAVTSSNSGSGKPIVGPIVGGVVGGVAALVIIGIGAFVLYRKNKNKAQPPHVEIEGDKHHVTTTWPKMGMVSPFPGGRWPSNASPSYSAVHTVTPSLGSSYNTGTKTSTPSQGLPMV